MAYININLEVDDAKIAAMLLGLPVKTAPAKKAVKKKVGKQSKAQFIASPDMVITAPYGLKKDGSPKKRPGRPSKVAQ